MQIADELYLNESNINFCKNQILFYQNLLQKLLDKQQNKSNLYENFKNQPKQKKLKQSRKGKTFKESNILNDINELEQYKASYLRDIKNKKNNQPNNDNISGKSENIMINEDDYERLRQKQLDSRKGLYDDELKLNKIREFEKSLIDSGISSIDAQLQARQKYYPSSLENNKPSRTHELLAFEDSDYESGLFDKITIENADIGIDIEKEANVLLDNDKIFEIIEDNIEDGTNIDPNDIIEQIYITDVI